MVLGLLAAGAVATGLGYFAARRVGSAYERTRLEMGMDPSMYYNQYQTGASYYPYSQRSQYYPSSGSYSRGYYR